MARALPYIVLSVMVYFTLLYLHNYRPEILDRILIQIDVVGITLEAKEEHARLEAIDQLPIHYEEKQVLISHTVFLGATPDMVKLALGEPKKKPINGTYQNEKGETVSLIYFVYYLPNDKRPTILVFQQDEDDHQFKLAIAKKGSALEWGN